MIDWLSQKNEVLFNPRIPDFEKNALLSGLHLLDDLKSHVCFATSGSSGKIKWVALSKEAILTSAQAVNCHLQSNHKDIWLNPLPEFHVGGAGILARGYLTNAKVTPCSFSTGKWSPQEFLSNLNDSRATLTSLVPTHVFDIVSQKLSPPTTLRAIIVGGGVINEALYFAAIRLGWNLLPSYGLTECSSQVATAEYGSWNHIRYPLLKPLSHVELTLDASGPLKIKSGALLTAYIEKNNETFVLRDPKDDGWFVTEDRAVFENEFLKSVSRGENFIKIGGENVDLLRLQKILEEEKLSSNLKKDMALVAIKDDRLGYKLHLAVETPIETDIETLIKSYHKRVFPFERIQCVHSVSHIPRSPLNKVLREKVIEEIEKSLKH